MANLHWIIPYLQQKQENSLQNLLKLVNSFIIYGQSELQQDSNKIITLISAASDALYSKKNNQIKESLNSEGCLLFQLLLHSFQGYFDNYLEKILSIVISRYSSPDVQHLFFKVRLLEIILAAFSYNFQLASSILLKSSTESGISYLRYILIEIINNYYGFKNPYDKKVAVIGLCQIFLQTSLPADVSELGNHIFETVILILSLGYNENTNSYGKISKIVDKLIEHDIDNLTDSEIMVKGTKLLFGEKGFQENNEDTEATVMVTQLMSPMNECDEIAYFKDILNGLNTKNPAGIKATIAALNENRKKDLMNLVMSQRIKIVDLPGDNTVVRKIVKAKHKN